MKTTRITSWLMVPVALLAMALAPRAFAQAGVARGVIEEAAEVVMRQAGREAAKELAEIGGKAAVKEVLEEAAAEGGESLVKRVTAYCVEYGPSALRAVKPAPARVVAALDGLGPEVRAAAVRALEREPAVMAPLVEKFGQEGLEVAVKHPGVGQRLAGTLGEDGIRAARTLGTDEATLLARHADDIAKLPPAERAAFWETFGKAPAKTVGYLERNPTILKRTAQVAVAGAAIGGVYAMREDLIGKADPQGHGVTERLATAAMQTFRKPISGTLVALGAIVSAWATIKLWGTWRVTRARVTAVATKG